MTPLHAIIFVTGAAVLALELLASRIMTPYFGVSLYIWTGILSITLVALALGYWAGGRLAAGGAAGARTHDQICRLFLAMPAAASAALFAACLAYPYLFPWLARHDLVSGAFLACMALLFIPLTATSAMNPLLVAILLARAANQQRAGDAGAGRVFFVSTLGSVAGVLITAFGLIPYLANFTSVLVIAVVLASLPLAAVLVLPRPQGGRSVTVAAFAAFALSATLLWQVDAYRSRMWPVSYNGTLWHLEAVAGSLFGTVKVLKSDAIDGDGNYVRVYFQDGLVQNVVRSDGKSLALYTFAMEALARAYRPDMRSVLMLGLGAGITPMRLANAGLAVEAVEIDRASIDIATRYFGFEPRRVTTHVQDARTFLRTCDKRYDIVLVDLFHGDGMPDYLLTREFFSDLKGCLDNRGVAVFNSIAEVQNSIAYAHFLATLHAELPAIALYRPADEGAVHVNSFVVAAAVPLADPLPAVPEGMPAKQARILAEMLRHPRPLDAGLLRGGVVVTDERNAAAGDLARAQLSYRTALVRALPPAFLLN